MPLPTPVVSSIGINKVHLRKFATPYYQAFCCNCTWVSFDYPNEEEAADRAIAHAERCCARINEELALKVDVYAVKAEDLNPGDRVLLRSLQTLDIEAAEIMEADGEEDEVWLTYSIGGLESQIMALPLGHLCKVVVL